MLKQASTMKTEPSKSSSLLKMSSDLFVPEGEMSTRSRYRKNETILAQRLMQEKPSGLKGLAFVLAEIANAQNKGLIAQAKDVQKFGLFAHAIRHNITTKLSKQDKDK